METYESHRRKLRRLQRKNYILLRRFKRYVASAKGAYVRWMYYFEHTDPELSGKYSRIVAHIETGIQPVLVRYTSDMLDILEEEITPNNIYDLKLKLLKFKEREMGLITSYFRECLIKEFPERRVYEERLNYFANLISRLSARLKKLVDEEFIEEEIGVDAETGHTIFYRPATKEYILRHKDMLFEIRRSKELGVELTCSVETGKGHEVPFIAEVACATSVKELDRGKLTYFIEGLVEKLDGYFHHYFEEVKSGVQKKGIEYRMVGVMPPAFPMAELIIEKKSVRPWHQKERRAI